MKTTGTIQIKTGLTQRQLDALRAEAEHLGISLAELIRRIVDNYLASDGRAAFAGEVRKPHAR